MAERKHTPGPWRVVYYDCGDRDYYDHGGPCPSIEAPQSEDCGIVHWDGFKQQYWSSANGNQKQIEANARLIAAAPDMLNALKATLHMLDALVTESGRSVEWGEEDAFRMGEWFEAAELAEIEAARVAIAKATGG
jgi:hypothetical protein